MDKPDSKYLLLIGISFLCSVVFMGVWALAHPHINEILYPIGKATLDAGLSREINPTLSIVLTTIVDLVEYVAMSLISAIPSSLILYFSNVNNIRIASVLIAVIVVVVLVSTRLWLLYVPPTINAVVGVGVLSILIVLSNIYVYKISNKTLMRLISASN